jgi:hypothetical protein
MGSEWIIGALAFMTIGGTVALSVFHFGVHLKDPKNRDAAKRVANDLESAATRVSAEGVNGRSLSQRLDDAPKLNERLGKRKGSSIGLWDVIFETRWSVLRSALRLGSK